MLGRTFGEFQLIRLIGRGSVARVFLASDGEAVKAVKVFPAVHSRRADREFEFGSGLKHPHLNPIEGQLELGGLPCLVMPFVRGQPLAVNDRTKNSAREFITAMLGVTDALGYMHGRGIVHRDLKPENIVVDADGQAVVIDFDLATRSLQETDRHVLTGTIAFLSPEQARAEPVSPASDMYSLGAILYWGLTGEIPFSGDPAQVLSSHQNATAAPVSALRPTCSGFDPLVSALLDKDPGSRPDAATALSQLLHLLPQVPH